MITDTELRVKGFRALSKALGTVEAEKFITLTKREPFDYTRWQRELFEAMSVAEISHAAAAVREKKRHGAKRR